MPLADNVLRLRVTDGKTIEEVADGAKLPPALVAAIEGGRRSVPPKSLKALATYFGVSVEFLQR
ncbi:helix-turn-helix domain-containing protein [Aureimonas leprariae]|uniref:Helix-turn-helix transcriptional regulator n=1 Tax=Plantimonas leprariae TaxID=2615207 RepID=A0A7V7TYB2_9HYPH|nr:helix-turn-helix transcriptional regulator [Aureimonas leprariae]KAB0682802.1 helix-turn-helix transcriptional regulator [Aureimonas leprariae]